MAESTPDKALKIKSLLQSYYAEDSSNAGAVSSSLRPSPARPQFPPTTTASPAPSIQGTINSSIATTAALSDALDTSYFDAEAHLRRVIRETRLPALVDVHRRLAADVASLDSDMQTLVYENYSKFIEATDIIRTMDHAMDGLDGKLRRLDGLIGGVVSRSEAVSGRLEERQAAIDDLTRSRALLEQLQTLLDVPKRLRAALDRKALDVAAEVYSDAAPAFTALGQRKALHAAATATEKCRVEAVQQLRKQLACDPASAAETVALIAKFGEPTDSLQDDFLGCQCSRLKLILDEAATQATTLLTISSSSGDGLTVLSRLNAAFLPELKRTAVLFAELFDSGSRPRLVQEARELFLEYATVTRRLLDAAITAAVGASSLGIGGKNNNNNNDGNANVSTIADSFTSSTSLQEHHQHEDRDASMSGLVKSLQILPADISQLEAALPELGVRDKASELVNNAVRQHVATCFAGLEYKIGNTLQNMTREVISKTSNTSTTDQTAVMKAAVRRGLSESSTVALEGLDKALQAVSTWQPQGWILEGWNDVYETMLQAQAANWLQALTQGCLTMGGVVPPSPTAASAAAVAGVDRHGSGSSAKPFGKAWIPVSSTIGSQNASAASSVFPIVAVALSGFCSFTQHTLCKHLAEGLTSRGIDGGDAVTLTPASAAGAAATQLLNAFANQAGQVLSESVLAVVNNTPWAKHPPVKAPSTLCSTLLQKLTNIESYLLVVEQEVSQRAASASSSKPSSVHGGGYQHHHRQSASSVSLESFTGGGGGGGGGGGITEDQLLSSNVSSTTSAVAWNSRSEVVATILLFVLHAHAGALRCHVLNRPGFQQVQLDCHYLRPALQRLLTSNGSGGGGEALAALEEVLVVAAERCAEGPTLLEPAVLDRMIATSSNTVTGGSAAQMRSSLT